MNLVDQEKSEKDKTFTLTSLDYKTENLPLFFALNKLVTESLEDQLIVTTWQTTALKVQRVLEGSLKGRDTVR